MLANHGRFADPFFDRLVPDQRDQRRGNDEFEESRMGACCGDKLSVMGLSVLGNSSKLLLSPEDVNGYRLIVISERESSRKRLASLGGKL